MTREEAISQLKMDRDLANFNPMNGEEEPMNEDCRKSVEALDMAIKALEQEPCEDCISRQAAIRWVKTECNPYGKPTLDFESGKKVIEHLKQMPSAQPEPWTDTEQRIFLAALNVLTEVRDRFKALPSAQPEQRWIPVSERLPEEMGTYMTTIDYGEHGLVTGQRYYYGRGLKWNDECVIAWMPLPEPYKAESEDVVSERPTADVKPIVHAHWIKGIVADITCSNCDFPIYADDKTIHKLAYCPHCGAKMDEL